MTGEQLFNRLKSAIEDQAMKMHEFIQTTDWEGISKISPVFPAAYNAVAEFVGGADEVTDETLGKLSWEKQATLYKRLNAIGHRIYK